MKRTIDPASEVRDFLGKMSLFSNLDATPLLALASSGKFIKVEKGQFIFFQSDPAEKFYIVRSGLITILLESPDGREMAINEMRPGDFFGELGLLTNQSRSTSAVARTECELLVLPRQAFLGILEAEPLLTRRILEITANRLRGSSERESALAFLDAQARLAQLLLQLDKQEPEKGYITISQEELAQHTGLTRQTVAKVLGRWRRAGWLMTGRGRILLLKYDELSHLEKEWLIR
jgi:CRP/FNR family transcriptional regulator, cyclic AMP receptor protein